MADHALLSPSAAHRWLNCTAAPRLEANQIDEGSDYAREGTLAHAYCARHLKTFLGLPVDGENAEIAELNAQYHTGEMDEYTETYKTIVLERFNAARAHTADAQLLVEVRLDFSKWVPEAFGTGDAVIIADGILDIIDFKYGKGVRVEAKDNPQMQIYALGAWEAYNFEYDIRRVRMTIVQPRLDNLSTYELSVEDLLQWADNTLAPKAKQAYEGNGPQVPGQWCQFCKVKHLCKKLAETCTAPVKAQSDPRLLTPEEMASDILPILDTVATWLKGVQEFALESALAGTVYKGFKLVAGRSNRKITDVEAARQALIDAGFADDAIMKPREMRGITDLEKLVGAKRFGTLCKAWIVKPQGKPTLAPVTDKRPAYDPAAEDFAGIDTSNE
jgi:hypothetical protein